MKILCAETHGLTLHAAMHFAAHQCEELERLCLLRYPPDTSQRQLCETSHDHLKSF